MIDLAPLMLDLIKKSSTYLTWLRLRIKADRPESEIDWNLGGLLAEGIALPAGSSTLLDA
jgi:hypothetical protein